MQDALKLLANHLQVSVKTVCEAMEQIIDCFRNLNDYFGEFRYRMYCVAETTYLQYHKRLPGSNRTKRLRKKRHVNVLKWYMAFLENVYYD